MPATDDLARLCAFPRHPLGSWPTPVEEVDWPAVGPLLIKRDDLSGVGRGGVKARKIESLIGHMLARGYDELVTVAGNITNLTVDILPLLRDVGIRPTIMIADEPPLGQATRARLFDGVGDELRLLGPGRTRAAAVALRAYGRGRARGRRPLLIPPGGSHPASVAGIAAGFVELVTQLEAADRPVPRTVFVTGATGTTLAGFLVAEHALRRAGRAPVRVVGVRVHPSPLHAQVLALVRWSERSLGLRGRVPRERIALVRSQTPASFGRFPQSLARHCERVEEELGIKLDPIFGARTWAALEAAGRSQPGPVLFWHCGYTPTWREIGRAA